MLCSENLFVFDPSIVQENLSFPLFDYGDHNPNNSLFYRK